jgi:hypothetical protein
MEASVRDSQQGRRVGVRVEDHWWAGPRIWTWNISDIGSGLGVDGGAAW